MNRRDFVKSAVGASLAINTIGARRVLGNLLGANDRIHLGLIGAGGCGRALLEWAMKTGEQPATPAQIVAVSDVYAKRLRAAKELAKSDGYLDYRESHMENFLRCVRTREKPVLDALTAYKAMTTIGMSVQAYREGRVLYFDAQKEKVVTEAPKA